MGGKQKRAAKMRRWREYQTNLDQQHQQAKESHPSLAAEQLEEALEFGHQGHGSGSSSGASGCGDQLNENDLHKIRMEILRQRQRKGKKTPMKPSLKWATNMCDRVWKAFDHWPKWPFMVVVSLLSFVGLFFLLRNLIQLFLPFNSAIGMIDRSPAYTSLKQIVPHFMYKTVVLIDYLFTSESLSWEKMTHIVLLPDENYGGRHHHHGGMYSYR